MANYRFEMSMIEQHAELLRRRRRRNAKGGRLSRHEHIVMLELEMMTSMDKEARVRRKLWDRAWRRFYIQVAIDICKLPIKVVRK